MGSKVNSDQLTPYAQYYDITRAIALAQYVYDIVYGTRYGRACVAGRPTTFSRLIAASSKMAKQLSTMSKESNVLVNEVSSSRGTKRMQTSVVTPGCPLVKRLKRRAGEIYLDSCKVPPGITNPANNCYSNALIQCLFNNPHFLSKLKAAFTYHPDLCDQLCSISGKFHDHLGVTAQLHNMHDNDNLGQMCALKALQRMLDEYTVRWHSLTSTSTNPVSPYPMLSALRGISIL